MSDHDQVSAGEKCLITVDYTESRHARMETVMDVLFRLQGYIGIATAVWLITPFLLKRLYQFTMFLLKMLKKCRKLLTQFVTAPGTVNSVEIENGSPLA
jgi:hypothetical protein